MAKKDVIKPGHFKLAGRERAGKDVPADVLKQNFAKTQEGETSAKPGKKKRSK